MSQRIEHARRAGVYRRVQVTNDGAHLPMLCRIVQPQFRELPPIFMILQPQQQLVGGIVQLQLLCGQTRVIARPFAIRQARPQSDRRAPSLRSRRVA